MMLLSISCGLLGLYVFVAVMLMWQVKRMHLFDVISAKDIEDIEKRFPRLETLKAFESQLDLKSASLKDRLDLIRAYFFRCDYSSHTVAQHILWIIQNHPDAKANWIELCGLFQFASEEDKRSAVDFLRKQIEADPSNTELLWNASVLCNGVDDVFSLECAKKLYCYQRLNPEVVWRVAFFAEKFDSKLSFQMYMRRLNMPWDENEFLALEKVRSLGFRFLLPDCIADMLLRLFSYVGWIDFEYSLAEYAHACRGILDSGEKNVSFDRYTKEIEHLLSKYQLNPENETYTYIYSVLGRIAIRRNDLVGLKKYLDKMSVQPVGVMHLYYACDEPLLKDMIQIGAKDEARRYFLARQIEHLDLPAGQEMKKTLFD